MKMSVKKFIATVLGVVILSVGYSQISSAAQGALSGVVNLNTATAAQLATLPGIGEARANAIIEQRKEKPFAKAEELLLIKGIGDKMFAKLAPYVAVTGETTIKEEKAVTTVKAPAATAVAPAVK